VVLVGTGFFIPEGGILHSHRRKNLKYYTLSASLKYSITSRIDCLMLSFQPVKFCLNVNEDSVVVVFTSGASLYNVCFACPVALIDRLGVLGCANIGRRQKPER
jgi:hypothetical protein